MCVRVCISVCLCLHYNHLWWAHTTGITINEKKYLTRARHVMQYPVLPSAHTRGWEARSFFQIPFKSYLNESCPMSSFKRFILDYALWIKLLTLTINSLTNRYLKLDRNISHLVSLPQFLNNSDTRKSGSWLLYSCTCTGAGSCQSRVANQGVLGIISLSHVNALALLLHII